ncbi:hypothetical protein AALA21_07680 [Eggerthellaceae bacterium 3-80]|nr:hypothetical protein D7W09_07410 [bacterium D16-34]
MKKMPIDIKEVLNEATNIQAARQVPLSISVYIDDTAPADVQALVRQAFASASAQARVSILYVGDRDFAPYAGDDMACVVAGFGEQIGSYARQLQKAGVPTMVVTTMPEIVSQLAEASGCPIAEADLLSPYETSEDVEEPVFLDEPLANALCDRMGQWVVAACDDKKLAFALAFPFVRRPLSMNAVKSTSLQNAGVGLFTIIPGADLPIMTLNQAKMLLMIAAAYGESLSMERVKELACVVAGGFACRAVARQLVGVVPALGWAIKAGIGYSGTYAMGRAAIDYFEDGCKFCKLEDVVVAARDKAIKAATKKATDKTQARARSMAQKVSPAVVNVYDQVMARATKVADGIAGVAGGVSSVAGGVSNVAGGVADVASNRFGSAAQARKRK